jgi:hypothetical protein
MQGGKNWFLPKEMSANRFFCDSHWLEIWSNHFYPSMGPNGGSVAMDSGYSGESILLRISRDPGPIYSKNPRKVSLLSPFNFCYNIIGFLIKI